MNNSEAKSAEECMILFSQGLSDRPRKRSEQQSGMMNATGVGQPTVHQWCSGKRMPGGIILIKLWFYLSSIGYRVVELEKLHPTLFGVARLLTNGQITAEAMASDFGLSAGTTKHLIGELMGRETATPKRMQQYASVLAKFPDSNRPQPTVTLPQPKNVVQLRELSSSKQSAPGLSITILGEVLHGQVASMRPMVEIALQQLSPAERQELRQLIGAKGLFELSTYLNALCSEKALEQSSIISKQQGSKQNGTS